MAAIPPVIDPTTAQPAGQFAPASDATAAAQAAEAIAILESRRLFLESRDIPCPACRYNLRGVAAESCPECGSPIVLQLAGAKRAWVPPLFMALAFGWLLLAGTMNGIRTGRSAWEYAHRVSAWTMYSGGRALTNSLQPLPVPSVTIQGSTNTITRLPTGGISIQRGTISQNGITMQFSTSVGGGLTPVPATTGPAWSSVPPETWVRLGWAALLALSGLAGVLVLWRHRRRPLTAEGWARARLFAVVAFGVYAGFHVYWFVQEVI